MSPLAERALSSWVLYVDDEDANRRIFELTFGARFQVVTVSNGEAALAILEKQATAVVISDQRMPGMLGTDLLSRVAERSPDTVRVMLTAFSDSDPMLKAINSGGASRYLLKPWDTKELTAVIAGGIDSYQLATQKRALELQLVESNRFGAMGEISASVAHDMSSPLAVIVSAIGRLQVVAQTATQLMARVGHGEGWTEAEREAVGELPEMAAEVLESVDYLRKLVLGMRTTTRAGGGEEDCVPRVVVSLATTLTRGVAIEYGGRVRMGECATPRARISSQELMKILVNLISNAAQSLRRGAGNQEVVVDAVHTGGRVEFSVRDTGCGMTAEQLAKVGKIRFTTKPEGEGTGLGSTIVRQAIEAAGGEIHYASEPDRGTTVTFWVPEA